MIHRQIYKKHISIIVAVARNGVIGDLGTLPWTRLSTDLKRFQTLTMGKPVVMGRKTFDSLPNGLLSGRWNIVISRSPIYYLGKDNMASSLDEAIMMASDAPEIMIIGGESIYRQSMSYATRLYVTHVESTPHGDTHFPDIDADQWEKQFEESIPSGPEDSEATEFVIYQRKDDDPKKPAGSNIRRAGSVYGGSSIR